MDPEQSAGIFGRAGPSNAPARKRWQTFNPVFFISFFHPSPQLRRDDSGKAEHDRGANQPVVLDPLPESGRGAVSV
jgi:hypothetical protein